MFKRNKIICWVTIFWLSLSSLSAAVKRSFYKLYKLFMLRALAFHGINSCVTHLYVLFSFHLTITKNYNA